MQLPKLGTHEDCTQGKLDEIKWEENDIGDTLPALKILREPAILVFGKRECTDKGDCRDDCVRRK